MGRRDMLAAFLRASGMSETPQTLAEKLLKRRKPAEAARLLAPLHAADPADAALGLLLGQAYLQSSQPLAAVAVLEALPRSAEIAEALAAAYRREALYEQAVALAETTPDAGAQMLYEQAMALTYLGRSSEALACFDAALAQDPDFAAAWFSSHAPALELLGWAEAERRLIAATRCLGANRRYQALLAAYDILRGTPSPRPCPQPQAHLAKSAAALLPHLDKDWRLFSINRSLLQWALEQAEGPGLVLEFGVRRGNSIAMLAEVAGQELHGFDSFEGLPEEWVNSRSGILTTGKQLPPVPPHVHLHAGWFEDSLPPFLKQHQQPLRFANIDSDIYSSARFVLWRLAERMQPGTVLVFDEFIGNRSWAEDEYKAFAEFIVAYPRPWRIIAVSLATKQVAIRLG